MRHIDANGSSFPEYQLVIELWVSEYANDGLDQIVYRSNYSISYDAMLPGYDGGTGNAFLGLSCQAPVIAPEGGLLLGCFGLLKLL